MVSVSSQSSSHWLTSSASSSSAPHSAWTKGGSGVGQRAFRVEPGRGRGDRRRDLTRPGGHHAPSLPNSSNSSSHSRSTARFFLGSSFCSVIARVRSSRPRVSLWRPGGDFGRSRFRLLGSTTTRPCWSDRWNRNAREISFRLDRPPPPFRTPHTKRASRGSEYGRRTHAREERTAESEARARAPGRSRSFVEARRATRRFARSHPLASVGTSDWPA